MTTLSLMLSADVVDMPIQGSLSTMPVQKEGV
jgi:hypothetical protein